MKRFAEFLVLLLSALSIAQTAELPAYKDATRPIEIRIDDLIKRMTLEEKVDLVGGAGFKTKTNLRLGIPALLMTDGPLGPNSRGAATNYGATINMAASFDTSLVRRMAEEIGRETRVQGLNMLLAPMSNMVRTPFGGRSFEFFGEDPFLTSRMTVAYVKGVQSQKVATCTKVMIANEQEWNRFDVDVQVSERALREIYLPPFQAAVQEADTWSIMAAYNQVNGHYACENKTYLNDILKEEWGFTGCVVSDWGGVRSTVKTALAGLDLEMPTGTFYGQRLLDAIKAGQVGESVVDDKVRRILRVMYKAGLFDETAAAYGGHSDTPLRRALALESAQKGIVLLKNENGYLPLHPEKIKSIAVIGPNGDVARMGGGGSGYLQGHYGISPLQGLKNRLADKIDIRFQRGFPEKLLKLPIAANDHFVLENGQPGIMAYYFNNRELEGEPVLTRVESAINFDWGYGGERDPEHPGSPQPGVIRLDQWSARWKGKFKSPGEGWYEIGLESDNGVRMYLDGVKVLDYWIDSKPAMFKTIRYKFKADRVYDLQVEFYENIGSAVCRLGYAAYTPGTMPREAQKLASASDVVILCLGLNRELEGEANDRQELSLPEEQVQLLEQILQVNKNVVVVLNNGTPILMNEWIGKVPAVIEAFYPGQEGGNALADILLGRTNPSGVVPFTFPRQWQDCPAFATYPGEKSLARYKEDILVGYRWFDEYNLEPLFEFGYGLSYTTFAFKNLLISPTAFSGDKPVQVSFDLTNTGSRAGAKAVQLYVQDVAASIPREKKSLRGFAKIELAPGESKRVAFTLTAADFSFFNPERRRWQMESGVFNILIGHSSRDIQLLGRVEYF